MTIRRMNATAFVTMLLFSGAAQAQNAAYVVPPGGAPVAVYTTRSDYYRDHPRQDPEPFRCNYAADSSCPDRRPSGYRGDPRDDPEPFRCTYTRSTECGGDRAGLN